MDITGQWLGKTVDPETLKPGDLFLFGDAHNRCLGFRASIEQEALVVILVDEGANAEPVPNLLRLDNLPKKVRLFEGPFVIRPLDSLVWTENATSGTLAVFEDDVGIFVDTRRGRLVVSLKSGTALDRTAATRTTGWQLLWVHGDESRVIASFSEPKPPS